MSLKTLLKWSFFETILQFKSHLENASKPQEPIVQAQTFDESIS